MGKNDFPPLLTLRLRLCAVFRSYSVTFKKINYFNALQMPINFDMYFRRPFVGISCLFIYYILRNAKSRIVRVLNAIRQGIMLQIRAFFFFLKHHFYFVFQCSILKYSCTI